MDMLDKMGLLNGKRKDVDDRRIGVCPKRAPRQISAIGTLSDLKTGGD